MLTMTATPPGDWLSSVIALTLAAACDQPDGCYSCSAFFLFTRNEEWEFSSLAFLFFVYSLKPSVSVIFHTGTCCTVAVILLNK